MRKEDCSLHIQTIVNGTTIMQYEIWHILSHSKSTNTKIDNENIKLQSTQIGPTCQRDLSIIPQTSHV